MPAKKLNPPTLPLARKLLAGLNADVVERPVPKEEAVAFSVKLDGRRVAQVLARRKLLRLELAEAPPKKTPAAALMQPTSSKAWQAATLVTDENLAAARDALHQAVGTTPTKSERTPRLKQKTATQPAKRSRLRTKAEAAKSEAQRRTRQAVR